MSTGTSFPEGVESASVAGRGLFAVLSWRWTPFSSEDKLTAKRTGPRMAGQILVPTERQGRAPCVYTFSLFCFEPVSVFVARQLYSSLPHQALRKVLPVATSRACALLAASSYPPTAGASPIP